MRHLIVEVRWVLAAACVMLTLPVAAQESAERYQCCIDIPANFLYIASVRI